jgi:hypothetical protein
LFLSAIPVAAVVVAVVHRCNVVDLRVLLPGFHRWFWRLFIKRARRVSIFFLLIAAYLLASWLRVVIASPFLPSHSDWIIFGLIFGPFVGIGVGVFFEYRTGRAPVY